MRTFVAVEVGEEVARLAAVVLGRLREIAGNDFKWVDPRNFHLTIKFLGPTRRADLTKLSEALQALASRVAPFNLEFAGVGAFPNVRHPQVVWLGVSVGREPLAALAGQTEAACESLGWPREPKPYRAHLTLARAREPQRHPPIGGHAVSTGEASLRAVKLVEALEADREAAAGTTMVSRLVLMESRLSPHGPTYTVIDSYPFRPFTSFALSR